MWRITKKETNSETPLVTASGQGERWGAGRAGGVDCRRERFKDRMHNMERTAAILE